MKTIVLFLISWTIFFISEAQTWKIPVYRQTDESRLKTLKFTPKTYCTVRIRLPETDSVKENITYQGLFHSVSMDSLVIKPDLYKSFKELPRGIRQTTIISADPSLKDNLPGGGLKPFALADIGFLSYQKRTKLIYTADDIFKPVIFTSLFVIILSPLISYDFKEGELNTERYKKWALGSTLTMTSCFAVLMAINLPNHRREYQFQPGWPEKKAKVWKFKVAQP